MTRGCVLLAGVALLGLEMGISQTFEQAFPDFEEYPVLYEAMRLDPFVGRSAPFHSTEEDLNRAEAVRLYEQFANETELEAWREATVIAHIGLIYMMGTDQPDAGFHRDWDTAKEYYDRAVEIEPDHINNELYWARTHGTAATRDPEEQLDKIIELYSWISEMSEERLLESAQRQMSEEPPHEVFIDVGTGERQIRYFTEEEIAAWEERTGRPYPGTAKEYVANIEKKNEGMLNNSAQQNVILASGVPGGLQRIIEELPGTPIAQLARAALGKQGKETYEGLVEAMQTLAEKGEASDDPIDDPEDAVDSADQIPSAPSSTPALAAAVGNAPTVTQKDAMAMPAPDAESGSKWGYIVAVVIVGAVIVFGVLTVARRYRRA